MGYDLVGKTSLKDYEEKGYDGSVLIHVQCPYAWQEKFRSAIGCEITDFNGRLTKKNYMNFVNALDNIIKMIKSGESVVQWRGNLSNCTNEQLLKDLLELRQGVINRSIKYISIS
jgi:hypothetical protein